MPMSVILVIAASGWSGFYTVWLGKLPLLVFLALISKLFTFLLFLLPHSSVLPPFLLPSFPLSAGILLSVFFAFILPYNKPPHWFPQMILGTLAFVMSVAWLNIEANEVVAVLDAFGLLFSIDTG